LTRGIRKRLQSCLSLGSALAAVILGGCALSPEQLALPGPITGAASQNHSTSGPVSDGGTDTRQADIREGSGQFTGGGPAQGGSQRAMSRVDAEGVTLNLVGASVQEVAKTVLGDVLKVNYTVSDKIKASITLSTAQPVAKDELLKVFEYVLRSEGIAIAEENGVYHILPADSVPSRAPRWAGPARGKAGTATAIVPLRYVSAAEMERVLKSVAPQTSILRVDSARNLLLVSGTQAELDSIDATVETFDVDWMRGMSFALLPLESGDPETVAKELDTVFANDADSPTKGIIRFIPNTRLKAVLVISSRPEYLRRAAGWVKRIDLAGQATERHVQVYHVQNRPAAELAALLGKVYNSQGSSRVDISAAQTVETAAVISTGEGNEEASGLANVARGFPPRVTLNQGAAQRQNGQGDALPEVAEAVAGEGGRAASRNGDADSGIGIVADEPNNALIITATHQEYSRVRRILSRIDIAANQVLLEATIAEVTLNDELRFGLKWFFEKGNNSATFSTAGSGAIAQSFPGFAYFLNTPNIQIALNALNQVTTVNLVSSPTLMVLDNKKAVLQIGDEVPVPTQQAQSVLVPGAPIVNSISYRNTGVILSITPRVGDNGRIQLDIEQEVSDVKAGTGDAAEDGSVPAPTIAQRRVKTSVAVGDGESIMLAGLMRDQSTLGHTKVPLMGDIPVVGNLFKSKNDNIARTELFIAITPQVVKDPRQIRGIADEFRDRMNLTTRPQRAGPPDRRENTNRLVR
jgi:general secretion pathway protein D